MDILKISFVAILTLFLTLFIKEIKPELSIYVSLSGSMIILIMILNNLSSVIFEFKNLMENMNIDNKIFNTLFKVIAVGYITEFSASICKDCQNSLLADKIILAGKIIIFSIAIPILKSIIDIVVGLL